MSDLIHLAVETSTGSPQPAHPTMRMACGATLTTRYESLRYPGGFDPPFHRNVTCERCLVAWDRAIERNGTDPVAELIEAARWE